MSMKKQSGLSLIELMIAMALGLFLTAGLVALFASSSRSQKDLAQVALQIENGRYAMDTLSQDFRHAGFYGEFTRYSAPAALPDPCSLTVADMIAAMGAPVQGFNASDLVSRPSLTGTTCGGASLLSSANLRPGSDIVVIRRADTTPLSVGASTVANDLYLQSNATSADIQVGAGSAITNASTAAGTNATIKKKNGNAADIRKYHVRVYFVAPCSIPADGTDVCTGANDDGGQPIPTLKRLDINAGAMSISPVAEGVEYLKLEYGIDKWPTDVNTLTGLIGDGVVTLRSPSTDSYSVSPAFGDWKNVVSVRIGMLVRNPERTPGYTDTKSYDLGPITVSAANDHYRRHAYTSEVRLVNLSSRRERP